MFQIADAVGPYVSVLKTHFDIIPDFTNETVKELKRLSAVHNFIIMEDRLVSQICHSTWSFVGIFPILIIWIIMGFTLSLRI